jgi:outer membrane protein
MKRNILLVVLVAFLVSGLSIIQDSQAAEMKIGYVDVAGVFDGYDKTKDQDATLSEKSDKKQQQRERYVEKIRNMKNEFELLSEKQRQSKQEEIDKEVRKLQDFERETRADLQRQRDDMIRGILKEIDGVISDYAKQNGYTLVLNSRVLVYAQEQDDLTREILNILNSNYRRTKK